MTAQATASSHSTAPASSFEDRRGYFTVQAAGALFGLPVDAVQTIFRLQSITPVPLGPSVIAGLVNLRGKIVTAISLERRLGLKSTAAAPTTALAVAVERRGETFALIVDSVGDAIECDERDLLPSPRHILDQRAQLTKAYYRTDGGILPVLDVDALFDLRADRRMPQPQTTRPVAATGT